MAKICDRQRFIDSHILCIVQELFGVDTQGLIVPERLFENRFSQ